MFKSRGFLNKEIWFVVWLGIKNVMFALRGDVSVDHMY